MNKIEGMASANNGMLHIVVRNTADTPEEAQASAQMMKDMLATLADRFPVFVRRAVTIDQQRQFEYATSEYAASCRFTVDVLGASGKEDPGFYNVTKPDANPGDNK